MSAHTGQSIKKLYSRSVRALRRRNHEDALILTQEIIDRQPDHAGAYAVQFSSLFKNKKFELARLMGSKAAEHNPKSAFILNNQACLELEKNNPAPAIDLLSSLIEQYGEHAQWVYNLALAYELIGQYEKAISMYRLTLDQNPQHEKAARKLSETSELLGHFEEATQSYDYWRLLASKNESSHCQFIHCSVKSNNISKSNLKLELNLWRDRFIPKGKRYEVEDLSNKKSITIGFIYSGFDYEWLNKIVKPVAKQLAKNGDQVIFYSAAPIEKIDDEISLVVTQKLSDANFARRVREDQVDVLIDLCGMRKGNRQRALSLQLASHQYAWLNHEGHFATSLVQSLDEKLERTFIDLNDDNQESEKNRKWPSKTFAGLAGHNGLSFQVIKAWAAVLFQCPDWSINIQTQRLSTEAHKVAEVNKAQVEKLLLQRFSAAGISRERVSFEQNLSFDKNTIVLDNFYNNDPIAIGTSILSDATVVTLEGDFHPAKRSTQLMHQFGFEKQVCKTPAQFIKRAVDLANKNEKLTPLKSKKKHQEKLTDLASFTEKFRNTVIS